MSLIKALEVAGRIPMGYRQGAFRFSWIPLLLLLLAFAFHLVYPQSGTGGSIAGQVGTQAAVCFLL